MGNIEMIVWDVQHGNAIYLKTPNGKNLVFDLGIGDYSGHNEFFSPLNKLWTAYGVRKIDHLTITHPHLDHIDDILLLDYFSIDVLSRPRHLTRQLIMPGVRTSDKPKFEKYFEYHERFVGDITGTINDTTISSNYGGIEFSFFLTPELPLSNINNHSLITVVEFLGGKIIIPGDNEYPSLDALMKRQDFRDAIKDCDILIAPHHGRESAYHDDFVTHANPRLTIISDGSICDTSANPKYSQKSRGWSVSRRYTNLSEKRYLLTTNSDGEIYITIGQSADPNYSRFLQVERH